jgi:hypothetical protein
MQADTLIADKAYDADKRVIDPLAAAGKAAVIPSNPTAKHLASWTSTLTRPGI